MTPRRLDDDLLPEDDDRPEGAPPRRTRWIIGAALVAGGAVIAGAILVSVNLTQPPVDTSAESSVEPTEEPPPPLSVATPEPAPLGDEETATVAATVAVEDLVAAGNEILQRADGGTEGIDAIATGFVRGELQALAVERKQLGYTQVGAAEVTSVAVRSIDLTSAPPTALLEVCIDTSGLDVLDSAGKSVGDQLYQPGHPVLHLYGAVFTDGVWRISTHEIPDVASCPE